MHFTEIFAIGELNKMWAYIECGNAELASNESVSYAHELTDKLVESAEIGPIDPVIVNQRKKPMYIKLTMSSAMNKTFYRLYGLGMQNGLTNEHPTLDIEAKAIDVGREKMRDALAPRLDDAHAILTSLKAHEGGVMTRARIATLANVSTSYGNRVISKLVALKMLKFDNGEPIRFIDYANAARYVSDNII